MHEVNFLLNVVIIVYMANRKERPVDNLRAICLTSRALRYPFLTVREEVDVRRPLVRDAQV
jgi:hypothetical protein